MIVCAWMINTVWPSRYLAELCTLCVNRQNNLYVYILTFLYWCVDCTLRWWVIVNLCVVLSVYMYVSVCAKMCVCVRVSLALFRPNSVGTVKFSSDDHRKVTERHWNAWETAPPPRSLHVQWSSGRRHSDGDAHDCCVTVWETVSHSFQRLTVRGETVSPSQHC